MEEQPPRAGARETTAGNRKGLVVMALALTVIGFLIDAGTGVGRAVGGPEDTGCGGEVDADIPLSAEATGECSFVGLAAHSDRLQVLHEQVFEPLCVGCHSATLASGGLDLSDPTQTHEALVGVLAVNAVAKENGWTLVRPGDPERSFLYRKVTSPGVGEGAAMPPGEHSLAEGYVDLLRQWIAEGAKEYKGERPLTAAACDPLQARTEGSMAFAHPETECRECHAQHVEEWSVSSHAYAAKDPVFHAMVRLGQGQSQGKVGQFCVQCHSPVGMALGETEVYFDEDIQKFQQRTEGLSDVAAAGVSCDVCHSVTAVLEPKNARMIMSPNGVRRATIEDPIENAAHGSAHSALHGSSFLCSSCHAVTTPKGALVEETYQEWEQSSQASSGPSARVVTCPHTRDRQRPMHQSALCIDIISRASTCLSSLRKHSLGTTSYESKPLRCCAPRPRWRSRLQRTEPRYA
ncbi:MAG: multiheme c-type cytochrome [Myxococcota bacterium]